MKKIIVLVGIVIMAYPAIAGAVVGLSIGGKVGYATYNGDVLPASGDVGGAVYYGAILELTTLPVLDFELHANYFSKDIQYAYNFEGIPIATAFEFQDFSVLALLKKNLIAVPASPFSVYVGAGLGWHIMNTQVALHFVDTGLDPSLIDSPLALAEETGKMSADGLIGAKLAFPVMPLAIFAESRYGVIFTESRIRTLAVEGGLMLDF